MKEVVITNGVRTPIGKIGKSLRNTTEEYLGSLVLQEILKNRANINLNALSHIIMGQVRQGADPSNLARVCALHAGVPDFVPAYTVHRQCGSGLQAIIDAYQMIRCGEADSVVTGGVENMSRSPYYIRGARHGLGNGNFFCEDALVAGGPGAIPSDQYGSHPMGMTAERLADQYHISREQQDAFAQESQERMARAMQEGRFDEQIVSVEISPGMYFAKDEHPFLSNMEKLGTLRPSFKEDGSVTAGNSSGRNDGAAALLVTSREWAEEQGLSPMLRIAAVGTSGCDPTIMGIGPVECTRIALERAGLSINELDVIELNEAFAAQSLAVLAEWENWGIDRQKLLKKVNPNGGAIAHGHPLGCTGAALTVKCMYELHRVPSHRYGLITLCCAGGLGVAVLVEKV